MLSYERPFHLPETAERIFRQRMEVLLDSCTPSEHSFFETLKELPSHVIQSPERLGNLYLNYQAAMHATRVMVYFLPYLNSPALRKIKVQIFAEDDGLAKGDMHHYQLSGAFKSIGAALPIEDEAFGDLDSLVQIVHPEIARFIEAVMHLYPRGLGAWAFIELVSANWMRAFSSSLAAHFPQILNEPYFKHYFEENVEGRHGAQALELAAKVISQRPELLEITIEDANEVAVALDCLWTGLERVLSLPT